MLFDLIPFSLLVTVFTIAVIFVGVLTAVAYLTLLERKVSAWVQDRVGPNRTGFDFGQPWLKFLRGFFGLGQPLADGVKFLLKEDVVPGYVDRVFYYLAPMIAVGTALLALAVVSVGDTPVPPVLQTLSANSSSADSPRRVFPATKSELAAMNSTTNLSDVRAGYAQYNNLSTIKFAIAPNVDIGFLFVFAIGGLAVYGIVLGGWSSNNKYSLLGSLRSSAQVISYEIPMGLSVLGVLVMVGSLNLERVVDWQARHGWLIAYQPLAFVLFLTAIFAECNRLPFDLPECEQELVGGYHTEYSSMKFALFFLGEYTHMITTSFLTAALFMGGWHLPWLNDWLSPSMIGNFDLSYLFALLIKLAVFVAKMFVVIALFMLVRWTILRFKFDQLMALAWKGLMPLGLMSLLGVVISRQFIPPGMGQWGFQCAFGLVSLVIVGVVSLLLPTEAPKTVLSISRGRSHSATSAPELASRAS
jgi:NADH-quinone oxidoreductase subunit H